MMFLFASFCVYVLSAKKGNKKYMTREARTPIPNQWPDFFRASGNETPVSSELARVQQVLLDVFHLKDPNSDTVHTLAVVGCVDDVIDVVPVGDLHPSLQGSYQQARVSKRDKFRYIEAAEMDFYSISNISQQTDHQGFNDPITLRARVSARAKIVLGKLEIKKVLHQGELTVGRLDLLHAYASSQFPISTFGENHAQINQLIVATRPLQAVEKRQGIGLVYPIIDAGTIEQMGNNHIMMRVTHDLLAFLQKDMLDQGITHPFVSAILPLPNRERVERELEAEGYVIKDDTATRSTKKSTTPASGSFIDKLRQLLPSWSQEQIQIPPQATPEDYVQLIREVLLVISTPDDKRLFSTLSDVSFDQLKPKVIVPAQQLPKPITPTPRPIAPSPVTRPESRPGGQPKPKPKKRPTEPVRPDYSADFAPLVRPPVQVDAQDWRNDFAATSSKPTNTISDASDWAADFEAATHKPKTKQSDPVVKPKKKKTEPDYSAEFEPIQPRTSKVDDWTNDFET